MPNFKPKICKLCGAEFVPIKSARQVYCNQIRFKQCVVCGKNMELECGVPYLETNCCSSECKHKFTYSQRAAKALSEVKVCKWCGKEFTSSSKKALYCPGPHFKRCVICGKQFEIDVTANSNVMTCSKECKYKYASNQHDYVKGSETQRKSIEEKYGVSNVMQIPGSVDKLKQANLKKYGSVWYTQTDEYRKSVVQTDLDKYGVDHHLKARSVINKRIQTTKAKYGVNNVFQSETIKYKVRQSMLAKYGSEYISQVKEFKAKATRSAKQSNLETRICNLLANYQLEFQQHYFVRNGNHSHEFDFFIPRYKLLIDADGLYYHSYIDDPDGVRVREDYDDVRLYIVPDDCIFTVLVETDEDRALKELVTMLESIDGDITKYDSILFNWCRSIEFPYPNYSDKRMLSDWNHLLKYTNSKYIPQCRIGQSIIKNFHRSIYHCNVHGCKSPFEGWFDDNSLKQVIRNRLIYKNIVDPSKILAGFSISKICPCVSSFNPVLAKYLVVKYLPEFETIFDPFSGFSGRLLGVASTNRDYIGNDINETEVAESNAIIQFLKLDPTRYSVSVKNIMESSGSYPCLLTCPPYSNKEIYGQETEFKTCDEWIDECLTRFKCRKYVFVVDKTTKYKENIVETIFSQSHINKVSEQVVLINSN